MATLKDDATQYGKKLEGKLESPESCEYKTMHYTAMAAGICMVISGVLGGIASLLTPWHLIGNFYWALFGLVTAGAEMGNATVLKHIQFLSTYNGKAVFYFYLGSAMLERGHDSMFSFVTGVFMMVNGLLNGFIGCSRKRDGRPDVVDVPQGGAP